MIARSRVAPARLLLAILAAGCGGGSGPVDSWSFGWVETETPRRHAGQGGVTVRWRERLTPEYQGAYLPVERAVAALDPGRDRIYVGSTGGQLYAMTATGTRLYRYDAGGAIESQPALDPARDELFLGTEQGSLHALHASTGTRRWRENAGGPVRQPPILTDDAVYVVTDSDVVSAFAREDGGPLWSYRRDAPEGFSIAEHAGLALVDGKVITGFTDGVVVALDATDGRLLWERDTSVDVETEDSARPRFVDVDTTPVQVGDRVYVASFAGGMYALEHSSGTVLWHDSSLTGVIAIERAPDQLLILSSADHGVVALGLDHVVRWRHRLTRGAPSAPVVAGRHVLVGESRGSFLALALDTGREQSRIDAGHGFSARAVATDGLGFVVSNGGSLFAFAY